MKIKAAFFDRDGTLIEDENYLDDINKIRIIPESLNICKVLQKKGYKLFVVSNQSGIARGFFDQEFVIKTHGYLKKLFLKKNVYFEKFYFCPHHPTRAIKKELLINCDCRKPKPGLLYKAAKDFNIDLKKSLMFGDKLSDIDAGIAAGCKSFYIQDFLNNKLDLKKEFYGK
ncbi:HAD-IIIA family hydrolase [Candidatus Dependentiae bacterium]|nr:HAD-IIIA family hydrolase [Candidatus Dependentiae bacterium]